MSRDKVALGFLLAFLSAVAGAVRYNLSVFAFEEHGFPYESFLAFALFVGLLCSTGHVLVKQGGRGFVPLKGRWREALLYGVLMAWGTFANFLGLNYLNETVVVSLAQSNILFTILLAVWLLGERFTAIEWVATAVILAGMFFLRPWTGGGQALGFAIVASGMLSGAFSTVVAKRGVRDIPPEVLMVWRNAVALAVTGTYVLVRHPLPTWNAATVAAGLAMGVAGPYLHGLFFLQALRYIDAAKAALTNRVQPAVVFVLSWLLLGKLPGRGEIASALLLVAGAFLLARARRDKRGA